MNSNGTNTNGWGGNPVGTKASDMRTYLEGTEGIGKLSSTLQSKIKQVKKKYLLGNKSSTVRESDDKLWLLSCSEIWSKGRSDRSGAKYGEAKEKEGEQYQWYKSHEQGIDPSSENSNFVKKTTSGDADWWWLRSPCYDCDNQYCMVWPDGSCASGFANNRTNCVSPGFSI